MRKNSTAAIVLATPLILSAAAAEAGHRAIPWEGPPPVSTYLDNRIAIDADGNFNDTDDWAASPVGLALIAAAGLQPRLVHYSYNNSIGETANDPVFRDQMSHSVLRARDTYGFNGSVFFDVQSELDAALDNLRAEIDRSEPWDPLFIVAAGPMEFLYRAIAASDPSRRDHVTVISHSPWNNNRVWPPEMTHTAQDVQALGIEWLAIPDQNQRLYPRFRLPGDPGPTSIWEPWQWMADAGSYPVRFLYLRMLASGKADASDAGMVYFLLHDDAYPTPEKLQERLAGGRAD